MQIKQEIKISVISIDKGESTIHFKMEVSNEISFTSQDFYCNAEVFKEYASGLNVFPKTMDGVKRI